MYLEFQRVLYILSTWIPATKLITIQFVCDKILIICILKIGNATISLWSPVFYNDSNRLKIYNTALFWLKTLHTQCMDIYKIKLYRFLQILSYALFHFLLILEYYKVCAIHARHLFLASYINKLQIKNL